jgi:hypothetical protein
LIFACHCSTRSILLAAVIININLAGSLGI